MFWTIIFKFKNHKIVTEWYKFKKLTAASPTQPFLSLSKSMKNSLILILSFATNAYSLLSTSSSTFINGANFYWADGWKLSTNVIAIKFNISLRLNSNITFGRSKWFSKGLSNMLMIIKLIY